MALLGAPLHVAQISGKLAGTVFTKGKSGSVLRRRVKPANPRTAAQSAVRGQLTQGIRGASNLSAGNVALWKTYASSLTKHNRVGSAYTPNWNSLYTGLTIDFLQMNAGGTPPIGPPATAYSGDTITLTAAGSAGTITWTGSAQQTAGSQTALMYQRLRTSNRAPEPKGYKIGKWIAIPATPFQATVTALAAGTYAVGYKFGKTATGQTVPPVFLANVTVT